MKRASHGLLLLLFLANAACASRHYYDPSREMLQTPADRGLTYEEASFTSRDGTRLRAWILPAVGEPVGTVLHLHGKGDNMSGHLSQVEWLPARGFNVVLFDYRGFGESEGEPSPRKVHEDALAALAFVSGRPELMPDRILVFGQSLGGAVAITAVARGEATGVRALVTESTLSSYRLVVRDQMQKMGLWPVLRWPLSWLLTNNRYSPDKVVDRVAPLPILMIHGSDDDGVPPYHCRRLFARALEPKQMWIVDGGKHLDALTAHGGAYREKLVQFFLHALEDHDRCEQPSALFSETENSLR